MTTGISLDFFDTLVEIDRDVPTIGAALTSLGFPCSPEVEGIWNSNGFDGQNTHDPDHGRYEDWRRDSIVALVALCGVPDARVEAITDELLTLDRQWTVRARDGAAELLEAIRRADARACILTNWDYPLEPYFEMAGLDSIVAITSAELGFRKPMVRAFEKARALMGVVPADHIHIGDSWAADVVGAVRSGARALWVTDCPPAEPLPRTIVAAQLKDAPRYLAAMLDEVHR